MLSVLITIDTEYSVGPYVRGTSRDWPNNYDLAIGCRGNGRAVGIHYQMDVLERHGLKAIFFVDPMPALIWGQRAVDHIVKPILDRGHDVQLHLHTEWLKYAPNNPLGDRHGPNMCTFTRAEQRILLEYGIERLMASGAPLPVAFRAGNYGANDDTLAALGDCGIAYDTSFPSGLAGGDCRISAPLGRVAPFRRGSVVEVPISSIREWEGRFRHAQIAALSAGEMEAAVRHATHAGWPAFVLVSHSFELFNRVKGVSNPVLVRRFERFCEWLGQFPGAKTMGFGEAN